MSEDDVATPGLTASDLVAIQGAIHTYYQDAFTTLLEFFSAAIVVVGVVIPIVLTYIQNKNFGDQLQEMKDEFSEIRKSILTEMDNRLKNDIAALDSKLKNIEKAFEKKLNEKESEIFGGLNLVQANIMSDGARFDEAALGYLNSLVLFVKSDDPNNFKGAFRNLESCVNDLSNHPKELSSETFDEIKILKTLLESADKSSIFYEKIDKIKEIEKSLRAIPKPEKSS